MSWTTMNGVNQAKAAVAPKSGGMGGSVPNGPATFNQGQLLNQPQAANLQQAPTGSAYTMGKGMMNTGRVDTGINMARQNLPNAQGVVVGTQMPSAVPQQAPPNFDPNDPRNAALAGYMNG